MVADNHALWPTGPRHLFMADVTQILSQIEQGNVAAAEQLLPLLYAELRKLAAQRLGQEKPGHTLQATALVHEAWLRLVDRENSQKWKSRGHFFAAAAEAMRRILIESARRKRRIRHGGQMNRVDIDAQLLIADDVDDNLLELDEALRHLASEDPQAAEVVKLRYFAGLTIEEAALALNLSVRTVNRHWAYARAWLYQRLQQDAAD